MFFVEDEIVIIGRMCSLQKRRQSKYRIEWSLQNTRSSRMVSTELDLQEMCPLRNVFSRIGSKASKGFRHAELKSSKEFRPAKLT